MRPITVVVTGIGVSSPIPMDYTLPNFSVGIGVKLSSTGTYTVQHTFDDVWSSTFDPSTATWFPNSGITSQTANKDGNYAFPVKAVRLNCAANAGTATMTVIQSSDILR